jgi:hypothetical protein
MTSEPQSDQPSGKAQSAAERMRAYRRRRRRGLRCFEVELGRAELDGLVAKGYLKDGQRNDIHAVHPLHVTDRYLRRGAGNRV